MHTRQHNEVPPELSSEALPLYCEKWKKMDSFLSQHVMNPKLCWRIITEYKEVEYAERGHAVNMAIVVTVHRQYEMQCRMWDRFWV